MKGYKYALHWIADNDDTEFLNDDEDPISVTLTLVADIYDKTDNKVREDLKKIMRLRNAAD